MKLTTQKKLLFCVIAGLALFLRLYKIGTVPPSLSWDEVSIGYNAYSLLVSGKDEHGRFLPLDTFAAYGDYKPPIPVYVTVPFIAFFGLTEFGVRFPVALFGTLTVVLTFYLVFTLFEKHKDRWLLACIAMLVLCLSPWHINLSRAGFEAVIALFFIVLSAYFFLKAKKIQSFFYIAFLPLSLAMYTFNSARYFVPFFLLVIFWYAKEWIIQSKKEFVVGMILAAIVLLPIIPHLISPEARLRFKEVNIFSDVELVKVANSRMEQAGNTWWAKIIYNRRVFYGLAFMKHYVDHFEPRFLFIQGDGNPKFSVQDVGQLYIVEIPLLVIGVVSLFITYPRIALFLLGWLGMAIIPAATARETPHALRILNSLPTWQIFISYGIVYLLSFTKPKNISKILSVSIISGYIFFVTFYLHTYYVHYPIQYSGEWQYGYRESFLYAESVKDQYQHIVVSDYIGRPYMYALFYGKYTPSDFWNSKNASFDAAGFYNVYGFGKYTFVRMNPQDFESKTLYILPPDSMPKGATEVFHVNLLNGTPSLVGFHI